MILENFRVQIVISESKLPIVSLIKFNTDLINPVNFTTTDDPEWQETYNMVKDSNPGTNVDYLYHTLYFKKGCGS
jgi:hypothetical protein